MERWISAKEFRTKYGYVRATLENWRKANKIRWVQRGSRIYYLDPGLFENLTATTAPREIKAKNLIPMLRGKEVAIMLGITERRLRQLADCGKIGFRKIGGRTRRYTVNDLRQILAYREARKGLKNGSRDVPRPTPAETRKTVIAWVRQQLVESA